MPNNDNAILIEARRRGILTQDPEPLGSEWRLRKLTRDVVTEATVGGNQAILEEASQRGILPGNRFKEAENIRQKLVGSILNPVTDQMDDLQKSALYSMAVRNLTGIEDPDGQSLFGEVLSPQQRIQQLRNYIDKSQKPVIESEFDLFQKMTPEQQDREAYDELSSFFGAAAPEVTEIRIDAEGNEVSVITRKWFDELSEDQKKELTTKHRNQILAKDKSKMVQHYSQSLSPLARSVVNDAIAKGELDMGHFSEIQPRERQRMLSYYKLLKNKEDTGVVGEFFQKIGGGTVDIVTDQITLADIVSKTAAASLASEERAAEIREGLKVQAQLRSAKIKKFTERGFVGKTVVGIGGTLPLLAASAATGLLSGTAKKLAMKEVVKAEAGRFVKSNTLLTASRATQAAIISTYTKQSFDAMVELGAEPDKSTLTASLGVGLVMSIIEKMQAEELIRPGVNIFRAGWQGKMGGLTRRWAQTTATTTVVQTGEEIFQEGTSEFGKAIILPEYQEDFAKIAEQVVIEAGPIMAVLGGGRATVDVVTRQNTPRGRIVADQIIDFETQEINDNQVDSLLVADQLIPQEDLQTFEELVETRQAENISKIISPVSESDIETFTSNPEAVAVKESDQQVSVGDVQGIVDGFGFSESVDVVESPSDISPEVLEEVADFGVDVSTAEGFYVPSLDKAVVITDNLSSVGRAEKVVMHESVGHGGVFRLKGDQVKQLTTAVLKDGAFKKFVENNQHIAESEGFDLETERGKQELMGELLARYSETVSTDQTAWQSLVSKVRRWLRDIGVKGEWSDGDVKEFLRRAGKEAKKAPTPRIAVDDAAKLSGAKTKKNIRIGSIVMAERFLTGKDASLDATRAEMSKVGMSESAQEVYDNAIAIGEDIRKQAKDIKDPKGLRQLALDAEQKQHVTRLIGKAQKTGRATGATIAQARAEFEKEQVRVETRRRVAVRGITLKDMKTKYKLDTLSMMGEVITGRGEVVAERAQLLKDKIHNAVWEERRESGEAEDALDKDILNTDHTRKYQLTMESLLKEFNRKRTAASEKLSVADKIKHLSQLKTRKAIENNVDKILTKLADSAIKRSFTQLVTDIGNQLRDLKKSKKLSARARRVFNKADKFWRVSPEKYENLKKESLVEADALNTTKENPVYSDLYSDKRDELYDTFTAFRLIDDAKEQKTNRALGFVRISENIQSLDTALSDIAAFATKGVEAMENEVAKNEAQYSSDRGTIRTDLQAQAKDKDPKKRRELDLLFRFESPLDAMKDVTTGKEANKLTDKLAVEINRANGLMRTEAFLIEERVDAKSNELLGKDLPDVMRDMRRVEPALNRYSDTNTEMTLADLLNIVAQLQREDINLDNEFVEKRMAQLPAMLGEFDQGQLELFEFIRGEVESFYAGELHSEAVLRKTGLRPKVIENYTPYRWDRKIPGGSGVVRTLTDIPGYLIPTVRHGSNFDENIDYFDNVFNHLDEMLQFTFMGGITDRIKNSFLHADIMSNIKLVNGGNYQKLFDNKLTNMIAGRPLLRESGLEKGVNERIYSNVRAAVAYTALSFRIPSGARQLVDMPAFLATVDHDTAKGVWENLMSSESIAKAIEFSKHPLMQERLRGRVDEGSANILDRIAILPIGKFRKLLRVGMQFPGFGDVVSFSLIGSAMREHVMASDPELKFMDSAEALELATAQVVGQLEAVYQSTQVKDMGDDLMLGGELKRGILQFLSADLTKLSNEVLVIRKAMRSDSKADKRKLAKVLFVNHVLLPLPQLAISFFMQNILGDDEFDEDEMAEIAMSMLAGPFRGVAFLGSMMFATTTAIKGYRTGFDTPTQRMLGSFVDGVAQLGRTDFTDFEEWMELFDKWLKMIGTYRDASQVKKFIEDEVL